MKEDRLIEENVTLVISDPFTNKGIYETIPEHFYSFPLGHLLAWHSPDRVRTRPWKFIQYADAELNILGGVQPAKADVYSALLNAVNNINKDKRDESSVFGDFIGLQFPDANLARLTSKDLTAPSTPPTPSEFEDFLDKFERAIRDNDCCGLK